MKITITPVLLFVAISVNAQNSVVTPESDKPGIFTQKDNKDDSRSSIRYQLPKKIFIVSVPFVITTTNVYSKNDAAPRKPKSTTTTISIKNEITVEGKMVFDPEASYEINFKNLGKAGKSFDLSVGFDSEGKGLLSSFNGVQESATSDIIKGSMSIVNGALNAIAGLKSGAFGFNGAINDGEIETKEEQTVVQKEMIILAAADASKSVDIKLNLTNAVKALVKQHPYVTISFSKLDNTAPTATAAPAKNEIAAGILYRTPAQFIVTASIKDLGAVTNQTIINDIVYIPQCGTLSFLPIPLEKGKRTLEIAFNSSTGNISKYSLKKESNLKASMGEIKTSMDETSAALIKLLEAQSKKENSTIQAQIDKLKLENERLELEKKKRELEDN